MSAVLIAAIPPQSYTDPQLPLHIQATANNGQRVAYGFSSGVVLRCLPDQVSFKYRQVETYLGAKKPILSAAVSPNGRAVVAGDSDGFCYVWLKAKGGIDFVPYKLDGLRYVKMIDIAISPDSRRLAIVGVDKYSKRLGAAILIDGGMAIGKIEGHTKGIASVTFSPVKPFYITTGGFDGQLCQHEGPPFKIRKQVTATSDQQIMGTRYSPCGRYLAACGSGGWIGLFEGVSLTPINQCHLPSGPRLLSLAWSPSVEGFAVVGDDYKLQIINRDSLQSVQSITLQQGKDEAPRGVGWSQSNWIVVPCLAGHIKGWKVTSSETVDEEDDLRAMEASLEEETMKQTDESLEDSGLLESASLPPAYSATGTLGRIGETPTFTWYGPKGNPTSVAFDRTTGNLVVGTSLGFVMFLSTSDTVPACFQVSRMEKEVTVKSCLINDKCAAAITSDGSIRFYRVKTSNVKAGDVRTRVRETLEFTSAGQQTNVFQSVTRQELVQVAVAQVDRVPLKLVFLEKGLYIGLVCTCGGFFVYSVEKALQHSESSGLFRHEWQLPFLGQPTAVATSGDGSLLAIAMWPANDYPASKFGDNRSPRPSKISPRYPQRRPPQRNSVVFKPPVATGTPRPSIASDAASLGKKRSIRTQDSSISRLDTNGVRRSDTLAPPTPTPASPPGKSPGTQGTLHPSVSITDTSQTESRTGTTQVTESALQSSPSIETPNSTLQNAGEDSPTAAGGSTMEDDALDSYRDEYIVEDTKEPLIEIYEIERAGHVEGLRFICVLETHLREISAVALNTNGSLLASADLNRDIKITEIESRKEIIKGQWNYHSTRVSGLDWSPDGSKLVSASTSEVYVWDVDKPGNTISVKDTQTGNVQFVRFIFNNIVVSAGSDGVMKVYEIVYE